MPVMRVIFTFVLLLIPVVSAYAYVDPGTGSMIIQAVIAALVGGGAILGAIWARVFRRRGRRDDDQPDMEKD
jgi:hypothetical protein